MADYRYERLTALDNTFLVFESAETPMHVASVAIFESGPLATADGRIDIERITAHITARLHLIPRYRQRLAYIPVEHHPVWVDDQCFNLHYHLRHTSLPKPGDLRQLKRLSARIMSQQLDTGKPLWETWIVEGLEGGRVAMISKVHHCMIDGISGVDLLSVLLSPTTDVTINDPVRWIPRPAPSAAELLRDELIARATAPIGAVAQLLTRPWKTLTDLWSAIGALGETLSAGMALASDTPLNQVIGPHRRFDWTDMDLSDIQVIRHRLGGSLNDVVLTTVTGAVRRFLERRGVSVAEMRFRVFVPVSLRTTAERGTMGNRVAGWVVDLPVAERDPRQCLLKIHDETTKLKESKQARGSEILTEVTEWTGSTVLTLATRLAAQARPFNLVVTNVPGPPQPLHLLGSRMLEAYPMVPLFVNLGLGIALFSNAGKLFWGFNADWDVVPDLHDFVGMLEASFAELRAAASDVTEVHGGKWSQRRKATTRALATTASTTA